MAQQTLSNVIDISKQWSWHNRWLIYGTSSAVVVCSMAYLFNQFRATRHECVPMIAEEDFHPVFGHTQALRDAKKSRGGIFNWFLSKAKEANFPPLYCIARPPNTRIVFVSNPTLIKFIFDTEFTATKKLLGGKYDELLGDGIFAVNGAPWRFHRKVATRMFSTRNLKNFMFDCTLKNTHIVMEKLKECAQQSSDIDINEVLGRFTLDTFCEIAFGRKINSVAMYPAPHEFGTAFDDALELIDQRFTDPFWNIKRLFGIGKREQQLHQKHKVIQRFVDGILQQKHVYNARLTNETGKDKFDILSLYLQHDSTMSAKQLYDVSLNFIIAGRDSTRMLLAWWIWELGKVENAEIVKKLYAEVDAFDGAPTFVDFKQQFKYLEASLCESLRLNPSVPSTGRSCVRDIKLPRLDGDEKQYTLKSGDVAIIPHYVNARNPKIWGSDAARYKPERWTKGLNTFDQYTFSAFNIKPRLCLGKSFAIQEGKIFAYHFLKNFTFEIVKGHEVRTKPGVIMNMQNGLPIILTPRNTK